MTKGDVHERSHAVLEQHLDVQASCGAVDFKRIPFRFARSSSSTGSLD